MLTSGLGEPGSVLPQMTVYSRHTIGYEIANSYQDHKGCDYLVGLQNLVINSNKLLYHLDLMNICGIKLKIQLLDQVKVFCVQL